MSGKVINGNDPNTRGNIARGILRGLLTSYRDSFNFGITSFRTSSVDALQHARLLPRQRDDDGLHQRLRRAASPLTERAAAAASPTRSPATASSTSPTTAAATTPTSTTSSTPAPPTTSSTASARRGRATTSTRSHDNSANWAAGNFSGCYGNWEFTPTDAGFLPQVAQTPRQLWIKRGWGYGDNITGAGNINETVRADSAAHFATHDDAARQRDQRRHRRDQEQRLLHADRRHAEHRQGLLPRRHDADHADLPAQLRDARDRRQPDRSHQRQPVQPVGVAEHAERGRRLDLRPGPARRLRPADGAAHDHRRRPQLRRPDLRRRHGRHARQRQLDRRAQPDGRRSAAAIRPPSSAAAQSRCSAPSRTSSATSRPRPAPPRRSRSTPARGRPARRCTRPSSTAPTGRAACSTTPSRAAARSARPRPGTPARRSRRSTGTPAARSHLQAFGGGRARTASRSAGRRCRRRPARPSSTSARRPPSTRRRAAAATPSASSACASCAAISPTSRAAAPARRARRRSSGTAPSRRSATSSTRRRTTSARRTSATTTTSRRRATAPSSPPTARARRSSTWAATTACCTRSTRSTGAEMFAYVPSPVIRRPAEAHRPRLHPPLLRRRLADRRRRLLQQRLAHPARGRHARRRQGPLRARRHRSDAASPKPTRPASCAGSSRIPTSATCSASRCWSRRTTAAGRWS